MLFKLIICVLLVSHSLAEEEDDGQYSPEKYEKPYEELSNEDIDESQEPKTQTSQQSGELNPAVPVSYQQPLQQQTVPKAYEQSSQQQHLGLVQSISQGFNQFSQQQPVVPQTYQQHQIYQQNLQQPIPVAQADQTPFQQQQQSVPQVYQQLVQQQQQKTPMAVSQANHNPQVYQQPIAVTHTDQQQSVPHVYQQLVQQQQQKTALAEPQTYQQPQIYQQNLQQFLGVTQIDQKPIQQAEQPFAVAQSDKKPIQQQQPAVFQVYQQQQQQTPLDDLQNYKQYVQQKQVIPQFYQHHSIFPQNFQTPVQNEKLLSSQIYQQLSKTQQQQSQTQTQGNIITPQSYSQKAAQQPFVSTNNNLQSVTIGQEPLLQTQVFQHSNHAVGSQTLTVPQVNEQPESQPISLQAPAIPQTLQQQSLFSQVPITATNYQTDNGHRRNENVDSEGNIVGQYSYIDPNGKTITVKYSAGKDGFKVEGDHLPKVPQLPVVPEAPAIPQYNPQVVNQQNIITSQINPLESKLDNQDVSANTASQQHSSSYVSQLGVQSALSNSISQPQGLSQVPYINRNLYSTQAVQPQLNLQALYGQVQALPGQSEVPLSITPQSKLQTLYNQQSANSFNPQAQLKYSAEFQYNPVTNQAQSLNAPQ